jgi:uncharacterized protein YbbC (DUF1343 family)
VTDPATFAPVKLGVALAVALHALYAGTWEEAELEKLLASPDAALLVAKGRGADEVAATWSKDLARFKAERDKYLLYASRPCGAGIR